jgi:NAD-dependent deacetylase
MIRRAERIACLTGAGMSTESGIPDFRSREGLYNTVTSESLFDIRAFDRDPERFYRLSRTFYEDMLKAEPNAGHRALAALEHEHGKQVDIATQNIDMLHQKAGCTHVYPVHGTTETATCRRCGEQRYTDDIWEDVRAGRLPIHTRCGGLFKPDIVFYGEMLPPEMLMRSEIAIGRADLLLVMGTSLVVYPAAALPQARRSDCMLAIVNRTPTGLDGEAGLVIHGSIGDVLDAALQEL